MKLYLLMNSEANLIKQKQNNYSPNNFYLYPYETGSRNTCIYAQNKFSLKSKMATESAASETNDTRMLAIRRTLP